MIDSGVVNMSGVVPVAPSETRRAAGLSARRQLLSAVGAVAILVLLTFALQGVRDRVSLSIVFLVYLWVVVVVAVAGGPVVGVSTAVVAFLVVNFFFTEPLHTLNVSEPERLAELVIFLAVGGTVATLVDTATRRREVIEERTAQAEELTATNELRTALLRAVSHDLRTPLTTAKLATSSLLATDVSLGPDERLELAAMADREIDRLISIVENLLAAGRLQAGVLHVDIAAVAPLDVVERAVSALPDHQREFIVVDAEDSTHDVIGDVLADAALAERVLANLLANALTADPGRPIRVEVAQRDASTVNVDVVDHGPGLSAEQRDVVFAPFQRFEDRGSASGIGLGLSICSGFCDAMGTDLELLDTPGGGLTARVAFPVAPAHTSPDAGLDAGTEQGRLGAG